MLMEEGKLLLDDPVKKYIPEFGKPVVLESFNPSDTTFTTRPAKRDITIRHLLTHSAGISYGNDKTRKIYDKAGVPIFPVLSKENITLAEAMKRLAGCPLEHDPGDKFTYGMNTDVLGLIIEVASGMPVDVFFSKKILEPLGMKDTHFYLPEDKINRLVTMYSKNSPDAALVVNEKAGGLYQTLPYSGAKTLFSTGAGLCGTIEDYAKLCQMILNGGTFNGHRLLSRKTVELMNKNQLQDLRGDNGFSLAYEVIRSDKSGKSILSDGSLTWGGWYGTDYVIDPKENLILLMYLNTEPLQTGFELKRLYHNLVYQALK
jgi:CubicO group peptidase (beta-lactamase class C family)